MEMQARIVGIEATGWRLIQSEQIQVELEKVFMIVAEAEKLLRHIQDLYERELALGRAVHNGEPTSLQAWKEREMIDEIVVVAGMAAFGTALQAAEKIWDALALERTPP